VFQAMTFRTTKELNQEECNTLLEKKDIDSKELELLLDAREVKNTSFNLVDVRELIEYRGARITNVDYLIPTTSFYEHLKQIEDQKETPTIVYCHVGQRSAYCQKVMKEMGFTKVINLSHGIAGYQGDITYAP